MYDLTPLGFDACRSDASASCVYWHTKKRAMAGATLTPEQLQFVGFDEQPKPRDGWKSAATNLEVIYHDRDELSSEDSETLAALMAIESVELNRERLEFLG